MVSQDNAPAHRSALVTEFLRERHVDAIEWPSRSPDLNPIKNVWNYLGRIIQSENPRNLRHLAEIVEVEWDLIPQAFIDNLVDSMPRRLRAVIEANGGTTGY